MLWLEWPFGWTPQDTGVHVVRPGNSWLGSFRERITLGRTGCPLQEIVAILAELLILYGFGVVPLLDVCEFRMTPLAGDITKHCEGLETYWGTS